MAKLTLSGVGTRNPPQEGELDEQEHQGASKEAPWGKPGARVTHTWAVCESHWGEGGLERSGNRPRSQS